MANDARKIGFIGLGDLGLPMAKNVVTKGYDVTVCGHRRREPIEEMKSLGAKEVKTPKEVAHVSDVIITVLRDDDDSGEAILGPSGVLEGSKEGSGIIMMSTLTPGFCRKVGEEAKARKVGVLDAPVIGSSLKSAITGEGLTILVGGDKELLSKYRPVLATMGDTIIHCGALGAGQTAKLADNMAGITMSAMLAEAVAWGLKNGLSEELLLEVMKRGSSYGWSVENWKYGRRSWSDPKQSFLLRLGAKDLLYALKIGYDVAASCPIAAAACEVMKGAQPLLQGLLPEK